MEFKDRKATNPGRIALKKVTTNSNGHDIYDLQFADGATEQGTPIKKQTLDAFKVEVLDEVHSKLDGTFVLSGTTLTIRL